jgi:nucleotide-binding universal stress UspA family protein
MTEIVVGVDGSEQSATALRWAVAEARIRGSDVVALLAWDLFAQYHEDGSRRFDPDYDAGEAIVALRAFVVSSVGPEPAVTTVCRAVCDLPVPALLDASAGADLLVVGARGLGGFGGLLLGSVSQQCLHHARVPVAIVRSVDDRARRAGDGRIVVGVDGSAGSAAALSWAMAEGSARGATVEVVHAWEFPMAYGMPTGVVAVDPGAVDDAARHLVDGMIAQASARPGTGDATVERTVVCGTATSALIDAAKAADLVVVGRRGLGSFGRLLLGSVSDQLARHAPCPVVVLPVDEVDA